LTVFIFVALFLGIFGGLFLPQFAPPFKPIGDLFLLALKAVVAPLIFASVTIGAASLKPQQLGRIGVKALFYFVLSMSLAIALGLTMVQLLQPGVGAQLGKADLALGATEPLTLPRFIEGLFSKLFQNPFQALAETNVLGMVMFGILLGIAIAFLEDAGTPLRHFFESLTQAMLKVTHFILYLAPWGVFALVYGAVAQGGKDLLFGLGKYIFTVVASLSIHALVTLPLLAFLLGGRSFRMLFREARPAMAVAFGTASSAATIPVTYQAAEKLKVPRPIASFVIPIGATVNMNGTALYEAVACVFIAQAYGVELQGLQLLFVFLTSLLAAVGAAAIPSAGLVTMILVLNAVGLPLEGIGLILGVDRFLDMCRTAVNVLDDLVGCVVVSGRLPAP